MAPIKARVRSYIVDNFLFGDAGDLQDDTSFLQSGIVDSTGILELVDFLEEEFHLRMADAELVPENLDSIDKVASFVERRKGDGFVEIGWPEILPRHLTGSSAG